MMKTINVVAAIIRDANGRILSTQRGYGNGRAGGNIPAEKWRTEKHRRKH